MFEKWLRKLARNTLSQIERKAYIDAIADREATIRKRNGQISNLHEDRYILRQEMKRAKDAFQHEYERILHKYGSFEAAKAYCDSLEGIPSELMDWYRDAQERWWNADWWSGETVYPTEIPENA